MHSRGAASPVPTSREVSGPTVRAAAARVLGAARRLDELWAAPPPLHWLDHTLGSSHNSVRGEGSWNATVTAVATISQATAYLLCPSHFTTGFQKLEPATG